MSSGNLRTIERWVAKTLLETSKLWLQSIRWRSTSRFFPKILWRFSIVKVLTISSSKVSSTIIETSPAREASIIASTSISTLGLYRGGRKEGGREKERKEREKKEKQRRREMKRKVTCTCICHMYAHSQIHVHVWYMCTIKIVYRKAKDNAHVNKNSLKSPKLGPFSKLIFLDPLTIHV